MCLIIIIIIATTIENCSGACRCSEAEKGPDVAGGDSVTAGVTADEVVVPSVVLAQLVAQREPT